MPWSELSLQQWVGLISGLAALLVLGWAFICSAGFDRQITPGMRNDEAWHTAGQARSLHSAIAFSWLLFLIAFSSYQLELLHQ